MAVTEKFHNDISTTLGAGISSGATTLWVSAAIAQGLATPFVALLAEGSNLEVVRVTSGNGTSGTPYNVTRADELTAGVQTAYAFTTAATFDVVLSKKALQNLMDQHDHSGSAFNGPLISNSGLASGAAVANIGYTPVNGAGDTMTGALSVYTNTQPQVNIAKSGGTRPLQITNFGNEIQFDKGAGSVGAGTYTLYRWTQIGNIDGSDPFWNGMQLMGPMVTEGGTNRFPILAIFMRAATATDPTDYEALFHIANIGGLPVGLSFGTQNNTNAFIRFGFGSGVVTAPTVLKLVYLDANNGNVEIRGNTAFKNAGTTKFTIDKNGHLISSSSLGTITAGTGAGTTPTVTVTGTDTAGVIVMTAGSSPTASANILTVNYGVAYAAKPIVIITPASDLSAQHVSRVYVDDANSSASAFILKTTSSALVGGGAYRWYYHVIQ